MYVDRIAFAFDDGSELIVKVVGEPRPALRIIHCERSGRQQAIEVPDLAGFNALRDGLNFIATRCRPIGET